MWPRYPRQKDPSKTRKNGTTRHPAASLSILAEKTPRSPDAPAEELDGSAHHPGSCHYLPPLVRRNRQGWCWGGATNKYGRNDRGCSGGAPAMARPPDLAWQKAPDSATLVVGVWIHSQMSGRGLAASAEGGISEDGTPTGGLEGGQVRIPVVSMLCPCPPKSSLNL
jgi:hypothetical protein